MDPQTITTVSQLVGNLGFPIVVAGFLLYQSWVVDSRNQAKLDDLIARVVRVEARLDTLCKASK